jgi:hypothetical protein
LSAFNNSGEDVWFAKMENIIINYFFCRKLLGALCIILLLYTVNANKCPNGTLWRPSPGTSFYWDLTQTISVNNILSSSAQVFDFDLSYITKDMVDLIHATNRTLICYIDTAYEPFRTDAYKFPPSVLGKDMDGWPGQRVIFFYLLFVYYKMKYEGAI